ncbi:MAG: DNA methyltransferase, partial [Candidatus Fonsibacter sp.]
MRHRFHSICPYFAMFPEAFVAKWVERLTKPEQIVLDPFCGRGTTPFQAFLMGRRALASDINPVAYCVTRAKTNSPSRQALRRRLTILEQGYRAACWEAARRRM